MEFAKQEMEFSSFNPRIPKQVFKTGNGIISPIFIPSNKKRIF